MIRFVGMLGFICLLALSEWVFGQNETLETDTLKIKFRRYVMRKYFDTQDKSYVFDVLREGNSEYLVKTLKSSYLQFISINGLYTFDIDKDTAHNFIIQEYLGGERQQTVWHILNLRREKCELSGKLTCDFTTPWLIDQDKDGRYEFLVKDHTFVNWNTDYIHSPQIEINLSLQKGKFSVIPKQLTDSLLINQSQISEIKNVLREFYENAIKTYPYKINVEGGAPESRWGFVPPKLWEVMLQFIYAGKSEIAWDFLNQCWYEKLPGKTNFVADFVKQLNKSPYWEDLKQMNQFP